MKHIETHLGPGEKVGYRARVHPFILAQPALVLLMGVLFMRNFSGVNHFLGVCLAVMGGVQMLQRLMIVWGSVYVVTDRRLMFKTGIIRRTVSQIMLEKADGILVQQSVTGRLAGYGTIVVTTAGNTNCYAYVAAPMRFKREINNRIEQRLRAGGL